MYCNSSQNLTLDHVLPKSRGGKYHWKNLVTACSDCNSKKGNKTPEEIGMKLARKPYRPTLMSFIKITNIGSDVWYNYL